jgi:hypothetical protein
MTTTKTYPRLNVPGNPRDLETIARHKERFRAYYHDTFVTRTFEHWMEQDPDFVVEPSICVDGDALYATRLVVGSATADRFGFYVDRFRDLLLCFQKEQGVSLDLGLLDSWMQFGCCYHTLGFGVAYKDTEQSCRVKMWVIVSDYRNSPPHLEWIRQHAVAEWPADAPIEQYLMRAKLLGLEWRPDGNCRARLYVRFMAPPSKFPFLAGRYNDFEEQLLGCAHHWYLYPQTAAQMHDLNLPPALIRDSLGLPPAIPLQDREDRQGVALPKSEMQQPQSMRHFNLYY